MAETIAIVGIVASIVQLVDFSSKVLHRLNDFQSHLDDVPESFRHIKTELPLLLTTLQRTKEALDAGAVDDHTKRALLAVIAGCREQIKSLDDVLIKTLPVTGESWSKKSRKAVSSLYQDSKVEKIATTIRNYVQTLTYYHAAASSKLQPLAADERLKILQWLSAPDPLPNYQKALKQHLANTGLWFLESQQYDRWKADEASVLWLYGIPGCGKTILSSAIIKDLSDDPSKMVVFFYFDFKDFTTQTPDLMVKSLITQLFRSGIKTPPALQHLFLSCVKAQQQASPDSLLATLHRMLWELPESYIVLDALDECHHRTELMGIIEEMAGWRVGKTHLLVTSRKEREIENSLQPFVDEGNAICLQSNLVDKDIQSYIDYRLSTDKKLKKWHQDSGIRQEIEGALMNKAQGMFRWATCQLDSLGDCRNRLQLRKSLVTLPSTLDETYDRILRGIREKDSKYAIRILQWLTFSARPLRVEEVAEVVALEIEREPAFEPDEILEDPLDALKICSSLVTIPRLDVERSKRWKRLFADEDGFSPDIVLAHYSVKEYLISDRICQDLAPKYSINESRCNALIAERCLKYLLRFQNQIPFDADKDNVSRIYKLAQYSAVFWMEHVVRAKTNVTSLQTSIMELFSGAGTAYLTWVMLYEPIQPQGAYWPTDLGRVPAPLYYASLAGMTDIVALLLANETGGRFHSALQAASVDGHAKIAERLMQAGANVNAEDGSYDSALQAASSYGHVKIVQLLLQAGANVNAEGGGFGSALQAASMIGHEKVVEQLLQAGANADTQSDEFGSVLQSASMCGYEKVVKQLLQAGANVNAQSGEFGGALQAASMSGHEKVIKQLLQAGANVNAEGRLGSALHWGTSRGNEEVVKLLLQAGADVHAKDGLRGSALHLASELGHIKIMEILVQAGADVNQQCPGVGVPLDVAVRNFETEAIKWLIQAGAKTDRDEVLDEICELGCDIDHRT